LWFVDSTFAAGQSPVELQDHLWNKAIGAVLGMRPDLQPRWPEVPGKPRLGNAVSLRYFADFVLASMRFDQPPGILRFAILPPPITPPLLVLTEVRARGMKSSSLLVGTNPAYWVITSDKSSSYAGGLQS